MWLSKFLLEFGAQSKRVSQLQLETREFQRIFIDIQQNPIKSEEMRRAAATNFNFDFITPIHFYFSSAVIRGMWNVLTQISFLQLLTYDYFKFQNV